MDRTFTSPENTVSVAWDVGWDLAITGEHKLGPFFIYIIVL